MTYLGELFGYNAKFADEVIKSLKTVERAKYIDQKICAWGSLRNLVVHLIEAEDFWINKVVKGGEFNRYEYDDYNDYEAVEEKWQEIEADILLFVEGLKEEDLKQEKTVKWDKEYIYPLERMLQHLYTHTVHHRGQIVAGISALGGKTPYVDII